MVSVLIRVTVKEGLERAFEAHMSAFMEKVRTNEPDPKIYEFRRVQGAPRAYVIFQSFADEAAHDRYANSDYHLEASPKGLAMLDGDPVVEYLEVVG